MDVLLDLAKEMGLEPKRVRKRKRIFGKIPGGIQFPGSSGKTIEGEEKT